MTLTIEVDLMSANEAADRLGLTIGRIRQLARSGQLRGSRVGRDWVFTRATVEAFAGSPRPTGRPRKERV